MADEKNLHSPQNSRSSQDLNPPRDLSSLQNPHSPQGEKKEREVYLDFAAATPMAPEVVEAMLPYFTDRFFNPSAPYAAARAVRDEVERARAKLAHTIGARPDNIVLTAGATEANNLAFATVSDDGHVIVDAIEHESVLACANTFNHTTLRVGADGRVDPDRVAAAIRPQTELISIELANGEIGTIQPIREIAAVAARERSRRLKAGETRPLHVHADASQAAATLSVNISSLDVDMLTLSAAKVYGPKQVGLLWASDSVRLRPLVLGGGQEGGVRSGTENVAGVIGFACALERAQAHQKEEARRLAHLRDLLQAQLAHEFLDMVVSGPKNAKLRLPSLLHVAFPGVEARRLVILLEREGVSVGTGSACAASKMQISHVLEAIGASHEAAAGSLRLTLGRTTTQDDIVYAASALTRAVHAEQARGAAFTNTLCMAKRSAND